MTKPCGQCPWRTSNQGRRHPLGFYTAANLRRLWGQVRNGGQPQGCHLTDPNHPDHVAAGCRPDAEPRECPGSVVLVLRELRKMAGADGVVRDAGPYLAANRGRGLTKLGVAYWAVQRVVLAGVPYVGGKALPEVDVDDPEVGLPPALRSAAPVPPGGADEARS